MLTLSHTSQISNAGLLLRTKYFYILLLQLLPKWKSEYFFHHWLNVQYMSQDRAWQLAGTAHFQTVSTDQRNRQPAGIEPSLSIENYVML